MERTNEFNSGDMVRILSTALSGSQHPEDAKWRGRIVRLEDRPMTWVGWYELAGGEWECVYLMDGEFEHVDHD